VASDGYPEGFYEIVTFGQLTVKPENWVAFQEAG